MSKFNAFEYSILKHSTEKYFDEWIKNNSEIEESGKISIFTNEFIENTRDELLVSLKDHSSKSAIKTYEENHGK